MRCFTLAATPLQVAREFAVVNLPRYAERHQIVPQEPVLAVRLSEETGPREAVLLNWGLIPAWARDATLRNVTFAARAESVATWAAFRESFKRRRCLIVADGYYVGNNDDPFHVTSPNGRLLAFAGLWDRWSGPEATVESCSVITTRANTQLAEFTDEMPVMVPRSDYAAWIAPVQQPGILHSLLKQCAREQPSLEIVDTCPKDCPTLSTRERISAGPRF